MKFSLVFENTGDSIPFEVVYNHELIEFFVEKSISNNQNKFSDNQIIAKNASKGLTDLHWALSNTNDILYDLVGISFPQSDNLETYLDQNLLNQIHAEWVFSQNYKVQVHQLRFSQNSNSARLGNQLHDQFPDDTLPTVTSTWLTASGNKQNGSMYAGRLAQRQMVVEALKSGMDTSQGAREDTAQFTLIATPAYPELIPNMIALSNERNNTLFVVGDTPMRLGPDGNSLVAFATNNNGLGQPNGDGNIATSNYCGVFYPSCQTTDLGGNTVVAPPSHMMVRTILRSDAASYPWLAPAGTRRGVIDNANAIGYIDATTGEFNQIGVSQSVRDILYERNINPITFIPGIGITNFGNKTSTTTTTALDRINVARLVAFLRGRLEEIGKLYLFEPNDTITRNEITNTCNSLMIDHNL